jgi:hypothetical protein
VRAEQGIEFRLNGSGAVLHAHAIPERAKGGPPEILLDRPFLLLMRKRGETRPFHGLWLENDELLEPWK